MVSSIGPDRLRSRATAPRAAAPAAKPSRSSLWDVLVFSTPALDQLQQAWGLAGQANGAAMTAARVPGMAGGLATGQAAPALQTLGVLGYIERIIGSSAFQTISRILARPGVQLAGRIAGRIAPFIAAGFAFFDLRSAYRTQQDEKASDLRKTLKWLKAGASTVAAGAGFATLALAPTGIGAVVAGGVALGAGLLSMGLDFLMSKIAPQ